MLTHLYIENIAVIEKTGINFSSGLNVLTGETGAGKSIVIDAINAILGQRTSKDIIRTGANNAFVSSTFCGISRELCEKIHSLGYKVEEDNTIIIQREISADGRSNCKINGRPITVSGLREIGAHLINIHGQHESYELTSPNLHITYIDNFGAVNELLEKYKGAYNDMCKIRRELETFNIDEAQKARKIDLLKYEIEELENAQLKPNEVEELNNLKSMYLNSEKINICVSSAKSSLNGDEELCGAIGALDNAVVQLSEASNYTQKVLSIYSRLNDLKYELDDCAAELNMVSFEEEFEPGILENVEERLDLIYKLSRKYGSSIEDMMEYLENSKIELESIEMYEDNAKKLKVRYQEEEDKARSLAIQLSNKRRLASKKFIAEIKKELELLDMPGVNINVSQLKHELGPLGLDDIQILISTNPGEPPKPIAKIASGGELSRIMLAIKNVLAGRDSVQTLIFDEVDTGISGSAAQKVGLKLKEVSKNRQVICVTHLAQIASLAKQHFLIKKNVLDGRTFTEVNELDYEGRKHEIARIIGGLKTTNITLNNAEEMLKTAENL